MTLAEIFGYIGICLVLLASLNGVKKYVKSPSLRRLIGYHYYFGASAFAFLLAQFVFNLVEDEVTVIGVIALIMLGITVGLGGAFKQKKEKKFFLVHRRVAQVMVLAVVIHGLFMLFS